MIRSFRSKEAEAILQGGSSKKFHAMERSARKRLLWLNAATSLKDLANIRSNHLEELGGDRKGQHSIRINDQWRICFIWSDNGAWQVDIVDYH